jgi:hypothetical protein
MSIQNRTIALGLAGALALGTVVTASAGPLPTGTASVKAAASDRVTDIRWRGRGIGPGLAFGLAAGALAGAAVAARPYGYGYGYGPGYYYDAPVYAEPYAAYEPAYPVAPAYGYYGGGYGGYGYYGGTCYTNEGYGRRRPCDAQ